MKNFCYVIFALVLLSCSNNNSEDDETEAMCMQQEFQRNFTIEPGQCVNFDIFPDKTFNLLNIESFQKTPGTVPAASIEYSLEEKRSYYHTVDILIYEDYQEDGITFSGSFTIIVNDNERYTVFVEEIEFSETESQFIFHSLSIRLDDYSPEY